MKINPKLFADTIYPVGIVVEFQDNVDRSNWLGFTWVLTHQDRFPKGRDTNTSAGTQGGEKTHTLTVNEMPSHNHKIRWEYEGSIGSGYGTLIQNENTSTNYGYFTESTGGGQAHNNEPQYEITSYWKRTA